ncbi:unnamed protein product [Urochloa humidicola]
MATSQPVTNQEGKLSEEVVQIQGFEQRPTGSDHFEPPEFTMELTKQIAVSPVTWRPAEEVLAADFIADPGLMAVSREPYRVYARRPKLIDQLPVQTTASPPRAPPPSVAASFIDQVTKPIDNALPVPTVKQRQRQIQVGTEPPRRSRRIANLPPENLNPAATSVCRELGFTDENSKVTPAMVEKYEKFFKSPLERNHVKLMATMMNKEMPDKIPVRASGAIVVV